VAYFDLLLKHTKLPHSMSTMDTSTKPRPTGMAIYATRGRDDVPSGGTSTIIEGRGTVMGVVRVEND